MTMNTAWTVEKARSVFAQLTKVANDMVSATDAEAAGSAGPQEVVDALEVIVSELEAVQDAIPAEPSMGEGPEVEAPAEEAPVEEEEPKLAKANSRIAELETKLNNIELEKVAKSYGELFDEPRVQQAKYDEVISSGKGVGYWQAQIEAISTFKEQAGVSSYKPAKTVSSWIQPRTKVAQQAGSGMVNL